MPKDTMTPRERWQAVLERKTPDRVPMDYWATDEATRKLMKHLQVATPAEMHARLHLDQPLTIAPAYVGPTLPPHTDVHGVRTRPVAYDGGLYKETTFSPLAQYHSIDAIEAHYTWPSVDWYDFSVIPDQIKGHDHRPIRGGGSEPFLKYKTLRGEEQAFMDLVINPHLVHYCLDKLFDFCYQSTRRIYETIPGKVLITYVAEDLGGQETLMFSAQHIREFLLPRMKRMIDLAHQAGAFVFHHDDGNCRSILPDMIKAGIDVLNPVQWRCKDMDRQGLKRDFGDKLVFHGAMDNQYTLPFGTLEEVRREVLDNLSILGAGGGYILAPCHNIQVVGPAENIVAMYDTAYQHGATPVPR